PTELAEALTGLDGFQLVDDDTAPRAARQVAMWNPPLLDEELGIRASALYEAAELFSELIAAGARTICFMKSRKGVELILRHATVASLRQMWGRAGRRRRGLAVYVAGEDALDQFFCRHPDEFLERAVEAAILDPHSPQIYSEHVLCAAHEAPLSEADTPFLGP